MQLTDKQWMRIEPVISQSACKKDSRGRKPRDPREVLNGILWVLRTGDSSTGGRLGCFGVLSRSWQQTCRNAAALISGRHL
ncbi:transposase [Desulfobulbus sp. F5]|nr:transposase [Desulfobulbus sp. F5]